MLSFSFFIYLSRFHHLLIQAYLQNKLGAIAIEFLRYNWNLKNECVPLFRVELDLAGVSNAANINPSIIAVKHTNENLDSFLQAKRTFWQRKSFMNTLNLGLSTK